MKKKIIIVGVLIVFIASIIYIDPDVKPNLGRKKVKELNLIESIDLLEGEKVFTFKDNLVYWSGGDLIIENKSDDDYKLNLNIDDPIIKSGDEYLYLANKENGLIYFVDEKAEMVERVELARRIFNIEIDNKYLLYHAKDDNGETVGIINNEGQNIMKYDYKSGKVLSYELNDSGDRVMVAILEQGEDCLGSRLHIYDDLKDEEDIFFDGEIILDIEVIQFNNTLVLTDKKIYYLSGTEIVWEIEVDLLKDYEIIGKDVYLMSGNKLEIIDIRGNIKEEIAFDGNYNKFIVARESLFKEDYVFYNEDSLSIYSKDGEVLTSELLIRDILFFDDYILIMDDDKLGKYEIIEKEIGLEEGK